MSSTFWIHMDGSVAVGDAVLNDIDVSSMPSNIQLMWWYGKEGEILYNDRLPIREPVDNLEAFIPIFDKWILAGQNPTLRTTSGRQAPAITLAQAKAVKSELVWGLYYNKFAGLTPGVPPGDNTDSVNASIQELVASVNSALANNATRINNASSEYAYNVSVGYSSLNEGLFGAATGNNANVDATNTHTSELTSLSGYMIPSGGGSLPLMSPGSATYVNPASIPTAPPFASVTNDTVSAPAVVPGAAGSAPTDPLAAQRTAHLNNIAAEGTVAAVAAYDITAGW